jgi:NAD(P)-dependent dehydrogenase (short-subunit alcohol dehydrogenase family)
VLDVFDEQAVEDHARAVVESSGGVDVSISLVGRRDIEGIRLVDMTVPDFTRPLFAGVTATFITARAAARHMIRQGSGVILALTGDPLETTPLRGGSGPADAATGALVRDLGIEVAPHGVHVLGVGATGTDQICAEAVALAARHS